MMCHVMGLRDAAARRNATHMGLAMQLTNICRDVLEDWERGRLYIPEDLLQECGAPQLAEQLGAPFPSHAIAPMAKAVEQVLERAESFYRSGDRGLLSLPWRAALAVRSARLIYSRIGARVRAQDCDITRGRAYVSKGRKLGLVARALGSALLESPRRMLLGRIPEDSLRDIPPIRFPEDVLS
jgi:phytoene synthase